MIPLDPKLTLQVETVAFLSNGSEAVAGVKVKAVAQYCLWLIEQVALLNETNPKAGPDPPPFVPPA